MAEARLLAVFADGAGAARAVVALRERGKLLRIEGYSPVPDAALQEALAEPESPVRAFTLIGGLLGFAGGLALTQWTSLRLPLVVGGKPIVAVPPFLIIAFELAILLGVLATVGGFLISASLPRLGSGPGYDARFSVDRCGVLVTTTTPADATAARELLAALGAEEVRDA
jgi:hypothetical protein